MQNEWSPEEEEHVRRWARSIVDRRMALPAILFLESLRPLHFVGGQFLHFLAPISGVLIGRWDLDRVGNFFEHRGAVPFVIDEIQRLEKQRREEERERKQANRGTEPAAASKPPRNDSRRA